MSGKMTLHAKDVMNAWDTKRRAETRSRTVCEIIGAPVTHSVQFAPVSFSVHNLHMHITHYDILTSCHSSHVSYKLTCNDCIAVSAIAYADAICIVL